MNEILEKLSDLEHWQFNINIFRENSLIVKSKKNGNIIIILDKDDIERLKKHHWFWEETNFKKRYVYTHTSRRFGRKKIYLHRFILNAISGIVDHINNNELDNRKCNLRIVSKSINAINRKNISVNKRKAKWGARVMVNHRYIHLGVYDTREEALKVKKEYLLNNGFIKNG